MPDLSEIVSSLKSWEQQPDDNNPFKLACRFQPGSTLGEIAAALPDSSAHEDLVAIWLESREAWLFEDVEYGQWGLHLLNPTESAARTAIERANRPDDFRVDDVILGY